MKKITQVFLIGSFLGSPVFSADGPEIFLTRYLGSGLEESFIIACPSTKATCQMRGTGEGAPPRPYTISRAKAAALATEFIGKAGNAVPEKKAGTLPDPGHEAAVMGWRVHVDGKVSQGILEREAPTEAPAKAKYEKARKALLNLETDLRAIQDTQTPKVPKKK